MGHGTAGAFLVGGGNAVTDNGALVMDFGGGGISGPAPISGSGTVELQSGSFNESASSTYTGTTTIDSSGSLLLSGTGSIADSSDVIDNGKFDISGTTAGASITSLDGSGTVSLGGQTLTLTNASGTFGGVIQDAGAFPGVGGSVTLASGTETVTGTSTIGGTVTIDTGATMQWGNSNPAFLVGAGNAVVDNGALVMNFGGGGIGGSIPISGSGTVELQSGSLIESGVSTYSGTTMIDSGSLFFVSGTGSIGSSSDVIDNGTFDISGTTAGTSITTLEGSGGVSLGAQTLTLTNASGTFGGVIQDAGFSPGTGGGLTIGAGTETLTGTNTFTGPTTIDPGATLILGNGGTTGTLAGNIVDNGSLDIDHSNLVVFGQTISGSGGLNQIGSGTTILNANNPFDGLTTVSAGVLQVGDAAHANASLAGDVIVGPSGTLTGHGSIEGSVANAGVVDPGGTIGTLTVGSYNQPSTGTLAIEVSPTAASQLNSLGAASLNGTLALTFDAGTYSAHVYPIILGNPVTGTFSNVTEAGSVGSGAVAGLVYAPTQVDLVTETTAGAQIFGGISAATMDMAENFASMVVDRFGPAGCGDARADRLPLRCSGSNAWVYAFGSWDHHGSDGAAFGFQNGGDGVVGGIGHTWDEGSRLGVAFGYAHNSLNMNDADVKASGPSYYAAIYGRLVAGKAWLDGEAFYMGTNWTANRMVPSIGTARSNPKTRTEGFLLQGSVPIGYSGLRPYIRFTYIHSTRDSISENGAGLLDYSIQWDSGHSAIGKAGLLYAPSVATSDGMVVQPSLQLGVQDNFGDRNEIVSGSLAGIQGTQFEQLGPRTSRIAAVVDGSLKIGVSRSFDLYGDVRARFGSHQTDGFAGVGGVLRF